MTDLQQCPYIILNVSKDASDEEIKKAYRRLAIVHHPDKNNGSAESTQMFQRISAAYAILSDSEKRERYDRTGSLNEEDFESPDMDDLMQMFFSNFGGGMMFGGGEMFFEVGGAGFGGRRGYGSYTDPFMEFYGDFDSEFDSEFDDEFDEYDMFMEEFLEVVPALFCSHFIEIEEVAKPLVQAGSEKPATKAKKKVKEQFRCTLCQAIMKTPEAAENHFMNAHAVLVEKFCKVLEKDGLQEDIGELFENFAADVKAGKITEKKKKKKANRRKRGPKISSKSSN